ncbi:hypothetical protein [Sphingomonas nostoxanthinifaciens]|uniref:hypothetical protein n=1 Tax=Sphingomonas nostoxanthinifaciens TaxID=2872652 RepID=UPI001CC1F50E|nr:hypothetical protein [Sphingomonas nostoxanthinifaciens]UAK23330.1 hypothetical protein K8P63_13085 [Sphingomonas nostoxanthinifaciens]
MLEATSAASSISDTAVDMPALTRSVATEMSAIIGPMVAAPAKRSTRPAMHTVLRRRSHWRPWARTILLSLAGAAAVGLAGAAYVTQPVSHAQPARPTQVAAATPVAHAAPPPSRPVATPAPAQIVTPDPVRTTEPAPVVRPASATHWAPRHTRSLARDERFVPTCDRACLRRSELDAHERLRSAYLAAADAGVSNRDLAGYRRAWIRMTRTWSHEPARLIEGYGQLADELDGVAQEVRSGEPD